MTLHQPTTIPAVNRMPAVNRKVACFGLDRNHFKIQCVCVYLEISVNTRSFKNCSTEHIQIDFYSNKRNVPRNFTPQIHCCAKFRFPKRNFKRNFIVRGTKSQAKSRTLARNFNDMRTIGTSKYRRKFAFFEMSHNFGKFHRNLLSLILHSTVDFEKKTFLSNINNLAIMNFRYNASTSNRDQKPSVR